MHFKGNVVCGPVLQRHQNHGLENRHWVQLVSEPFPSFVRFLFDSFNPPVRRCLCRALGAGQAAGSQDPLLGAAREPAGWTPTLGGVGTASEGVLGCEQPPSVGLSTSEVRGPTHTLLIPSTYRVRQRLAATTHGARRAPRDSAQCSWGQQEGAAEGRMKAMGSQLCLTCILSSEANKG